MALPMGRSGSYTPGMGTERQAISAGKDTNRRASMNEMSKRASVSLESNPSSESLRGSEKFLVDNGQLHSKEEGLPYYKTMHIFDPAPNFARWGAVVEGVMEPNHKWVKVGQLYLPRFVKNSQDEEVLVISRSSLHGVVEVMVDNRHLKENSEGIYYRKFKSWDDPKAWTDKLVKWGTIVTGEIEQGNTAKDGLWLRVGKQYLPTTIRGLQVLQRPRDVFLVTNEKLSRSKPEGLEYRLSKLMPDIRTKSDGTPEYAKWDTFVAGSVLGKDEDSMWLCIDQAHYLPMYLDGAECVTSIGSYADWWTGLGRLLQHRNSVHRWKGIGQLRSLFPFFGQIEKTDTMQMVLSQLLSMLGNSDNWVRLTCIEAMTILTELSLDQYGTGAAHDIDLASWFEAHLRDSFPPIRHKAVLGLAKMPNAGTETADTLGELALEDKNKLLRMEAARALGQFGAEESEELIRVLSSSDVWAVRREAALALAGMKCWKQQGVDQSRLKRAMKALEKFLSPIHPAQELHEQMEMQAQVREACALGLGIIGRKAIPKIPKLIVALKDRSLRVRIAACTAIGNLLAEEGSFGRDLDTADINELLNLTNNQTSEKRTGEKHETQKDLAKDKDGDFPHLLHLAARSLVSMMREAMSSLVQAKINELEMVPGLSQTATDGANPYKQNIESCKSGKSLGSMAQTELDPIRVVGLFEAVEDAFKRIGFWILPCLSRSIVFAEGRWRRFFSRGCTLRALNAASNGDLESDVLCAMLSEWVGSEVVEDIAEDCDGDVMLLDLTAPLCDSRLVACSLKPTEEGIYSKWALFFTFDGDAFLTFALVDDKEQSLLKSDLELDSLSVTSVTGNEEIQVHKSILHHAQDIYTDIKRELVMYVDRIHDAGASVNNLCFSGFGLGGSLAKVVLVLLLSDPEMQSHLHLSKMITPTYGNRAITLHTYGSMRIMKVPDTSTLHKCFSQESAAYTLPIDPMPYIEGHNLDFAKKHLTQKPSLFSRFIKKPFCCCGPRRRVEMTLSGKEQEERAKKIQEGLKFATNKETKLSNVLPLKVVDFAPADEPSERLWAHHAVSSEIKKLIITDRAYTNAMVWSYLQATIKNQKDDKTHQGAANQISKMFKDGKLTLGDDGQLVAKAEDDLHPAHMVSEKERRKYAHHVQHREKPPPKAHDLSLQFHKTSKKKKGVVEKALGGEVHKVDRNHRVSVSSALVGAMSENMGSMAPWGSMSPATPKSPGRGKTVSEAIGARGTASMESRAFGGTGVSSMSSTAYGVQPREEEMVGSTSV